MSLSDDQSMEITKENNALEPFLTSYEKMPLDFLDTEDVVTTNTETFSSPSEVYFSIPLPVENSSSENYIDLSLPTEEVPQESLLQVIKEEITTFLNIQKIEVQDTLPFIEIRKETAEDGK
ncbi:MAG: hypothetical protein N3A69_11410 [Leptospiraceae bacterium]|nr:hypothetical protein [Leptospiraceae bacterium]